jgi:hypothetical protein
MKTVKTVRDGNNGMSDDELGKLTRRFDEIKRRISQGTIGHSWAMNQLQAKLIETQDFKQPQTWKVWKTIQTGGYKHVEELHSAVEKSSMQFLSLQDSPDLFLRLKLNPCTQLIDLVRFDLWKLFPRDQVYFGEILATAQKIGLKLMTIEEAILLRLQYTDQPQGEGLSLGIPLLKHGKEVFGVSISNPSEDSNEEHCKKFFCHYHSEDTVHTLTDSGYVFVLDRRDI